MSRNDPHGVSGRGKVATTRRHVIGLWLRGLRVQSPSLTPRSRNSELKSKCRAYLRGSIGAADMIGALRRAVRHG